MPRVKVPRKPQRRPRRRKVRNIRRYPTTLIARGPSLLPDRYMCKMKYTSVLPTAFTAATLITYQFRGNSLYDPDKTGAGAQPNGFDELAGLYSYYMVSGSKAVVRFNAASAASANASCAVALFPTVQDDAPTGISHVLGAPKCTWKLTNVMDGRGGQAYLSDYRTTREMYGISKAKSRDQDFSATVTSNPANEWYWEVIAGSLDATSNVALEAVVVITYYVTFYRRKDIGQS